jgi:hypothetical protein
MKKPTKPLRARVLDNDSLKKAAGGRGVCHGYFECLDCGGTTAQAWANCPGCGASFDPATGTYGGSGRRQYASRTSSVQ